MLTKFIDVNLTHAAGVVFCHYKLPVLQVRTYARQLCDLAKAKIPKEVEKIQDAANRFAFLNMTAFDLLKGDVQDFLRTYHTPASPEDFTIQANEMRVFDRYLPVIKSDFSRRKLFDITAALKEGKTAEIENILNRVYNIVGKERKKKIREALQQLLKNRLEHWFVLADLN